VSGHVKNPGIYECAVGLTLRELIYDLGGGILGDGQLLAVIPGGSSCPVHRADEIVDVPNNEKFAPYHGKSFLDLPLGVDTFRGAGSMLGTCCAIVLSDKADPVLALHNVMRFYRHESCGQCTPCREGCGWIERILDKIVQGQGTVEELNQIHEIGSNITGNTICAFGDGAAQPALSFVRKFRAELLDYIQTGGSHQTRSLTV
jgi:NADH-quinone oxidoreductase subunit F